MSNALAGLQKPMPAPPPKPEWPFVLARLVVWDEDAPLDRNSTVDIVPLQVRIVQNALITTDNGEPEEGAPNYLAYYLQTAEGEDVEIKPEWVGKPMYIEIAPSVIRALDDELEEAVDKWDGTIA